MADPIKSIKKDAKQEADKLKKTMFGSDDGQSSDHQTNESSGGTSQTSESNNGLGNHTLKAENLAIGYGKRVVLKDINLELHTNELLCLLGPNGVGKSTLFKSLLGFLPLLGGDVLLDGQKRSEMSRREIAEKVAYVPQSHSSPFPYSVLDMVLTGIVSHIGYFSNPSKADYERAEEILEKMDIADIKDQPFTQLSGGQQQITLIARALMQDTALLLMDEPTAALDLANQMSVLGKVKGMADAGHGIVMITHDPNQCFLCGTDVFLIMRDGQVKRGPVDEVVTVENMKEAFGVDLRIVETTDEKGNALKAVVPLL